MPAASEIHILLVEDYEPMLKVTIRILNDLGVVHIIKSGLTQNFAKLLILLTSSKMPQIY